MPHDHTGRVPEIDYVRNLYQTRSWARVHQIACALRRLGLTKDALLDDMVRHGGMASWGWTHVNLILGRDLANMAGVDTDAGIAAGDRPYGLTTTDIARLRWWRRQLARYIRTVRQTQRSGAA